MSYLTKTSYLAYLQCAKHFWFGVYRPEMASSPDGPAQRRLQAGLIVDRWAQREFPDGYQIPTEPNNGDMAPLTFAAIKKGCSNTFSGNISS